MKNFELESITQEKDLGVIITSDFTMANHCVYAYFKANLIPGTIKRTVESVQDTSATPSWGLLISMVPALSKGQEDSGEGTASLHNNDYRHAEP